MIVYRETIGNFVKQCSGSVEPNIANAISDKMRYVGLSGFGSSQVEAWKNSLPAIADVLDSSEIDRDVDVSIEYKIRQSRDRIDFVIYGKDDNDNRNVIIVELKQWSSVTRTNKKDFVHTFGGNGEDDYWHPSYQAQNYANIMSNFNEYIQNNAIKLSACSYLHNMDNENEVLLEDTDLFPLVKDAPVFLKDDQEKLSAFISKYVKHKDSKLLYEIEDSRILPSKHLSNMLAEAIKGNDFYSYDEAQAKSVAEIVGTVKDTLYYNEKKTIIIKGGPGTGKSVVAINALGQLINDKTQRYNAAYVAVNRAPRLLYTQELIKDDFKKNSIKALFKYPNIFKDCGENDYDCLVVDEAHRIFDFKGGIGLRSGTHILETIIKASRVNVFFLDEDQAVTSIDYANVERIKDTAYRCHSRVIEGNGLELTTQFRVLGGDTYISFIKAMLNYPNTVKFVYKKDKNYDLRVFDNANDMLKEIKKRDQEYIENNGDKQGSGKCRIVAGYTYEWRSKGEDRDSPLYDIELDDGEYQAKWNLSRNDEYSWLNDPYSINEVGCIHTCQGLDLNYCGVIIGKDLTYRDGKLCFNKEANAKTDRTSGIRNSDDVLAEKLIRNTYNVLLTRGMKGTYIYCEDRKLSQYIRSLIEE